MKISKITIKTTRGTGLVFHREYGAFKRIGWTAVVQDRMFYPIFVSFWRALRILFRNRNKEFFPDE